MAVLAGKQDHTKAERSKTIDRLIQGRLAEAEEAEEHEEEEEVTVMRVDGTTYRVVLSSDR